MKKYDMLIDGKLVQARSGKTKEIIDTGNGESLGHVPEGGLEDMEAAIKAARKAFDSGPWRKVSAVDRGKLLLKVAAAIRKNHKKLSELEVCNNGKPLPEAEADISDAADCFEFYAGFTTKIHGETMDVPDPMHMSMVVREPYGVCGQIVPWNYPMLMATWKLAPSLAAGNTLVMKPSSFTPLTMLELAKIFAELDFPPGVVNIVTGPGGKIGNLLASHPDVDKVAITGGTDTGRKVMAAAAATTKKCTLELGGKNPNIILEDADFDVAVEGALFGAFFNQGEVCSAGSKLLVHRSIHKKLVQAMADKIHTIKVGHGLKPGVKMGPLVSPEQLKIIEDYVEIGKKEGATLVCGGKRPKGAEFEKGNFYEPTIFDNVTANMRINREEMFGPIVGVTPFDTDEEAIRIANDTEYGLAAGIWSKNFARAIRMMRELRVGIIWINHFGPTFNEMPWGGYKQSGIGRELGLYGIDEYLQVKQVNLNLDENRIGWYY